MKRLLLLLLCLLFLVFLCSCDNKENTATPDMTQPQTEATQNNANAIVGTWVCEEVSEDCYFIFDEKGDALAKFGSSTVYGYFDYDAETNLYDIDVPNFLYNEYEAHIGGDVMTLKSEESKFTFKKATMPQLIIEAPDNLNIDNDIIGDWQSADTPECFRFNEDNTAVITDMVNFSTVDCKYSCNNGVVTIYYMASDTLSGSRDLSYSFSDGKLVLDGYTYENVSTIE